MQSFAWRYIRCAARPPDGGLFRLRAAAREHVFVIPPVRVAVAGVYIFERALGEDVGAGRNLYGGIRGWLGML